MHAPKEHYKKAYWNNFIRNNFLVLLIKEDMRLIDNLIEAS